jgi:hypothetical protein
MVRVEVRNDDLRDLHSVCLEHYPPSLARVRETETGVDDSPRTVFVAQPVTVNVIDPKREREGDAQNPVLELDDVVSASSRRRPSRL